MFTIEISEHEDFSNASLVFTTDRMDFANPYGRPLPFAAFGTPARFIRLTVHRGHNNKGWTDLFGLSEIIATTTNDTVSFGAKVRISTSLNSGKNWYPQALTDGRMPHGIWHAGIASTNRGDEVVVTEETMAISWELDFGEDRSIDRIVLFPYKLAMSMESLLIANRLAIEIQSEDFPEWRRVTAWQNRPESSSCVTPVVLPIGGVHAGKLRVRADRPWQLGDLMVYGLSEIEVWSGGENLARGLPVYRIVGDERVELDTLTDGFSSEHLIADVGSWLNQLHERLRFDDELTELRPRIRALEADSELNVTFASAVLLGLTFLIPVFLYEKRRVRAKQRLETLRKRIAADLHDDVGGNLGSISLIARSARRGLEKIPVPTDFTSDLHEVELIARESSLAMRDIVWLIEQRDDSVGDLVARMRETGARMLREVEYSLACASVRTDSRLSLDFKRHFFLFFKEALHNVLKHSQARRVAILIDDDGDELVLEIQDDGVGMPQEVADDPNTSRKLRQRAEIIGGKFSITSSVDNGTCIRLMIHVKRLTATSPTP
ncbi:MAG: sensor histidine kinase [Luteolibacter sp.]